MLSPLRTQRIWLEKINVQLSPELTESKAENYAMTAKIDVRKRSDALSFRIGLGLKLTPSDGAECRYSQIAINTVGIFELPDDAPEDLVKTVIPLNCLAILHGFARGVVAQITGLNDGGPLLLPTVNFVEALQQKRRKAKQWTPADGRVQSGGPGRRSCELL